MFNRYVFAFEATSALLITAAVGAMVLAHRERLVAKKSQADLATQRMRRYAETGQHPGPLPTPGVFARHNAVDTPALLPDGSVSELSVSATLRARGDILEQHRPGGPDRRDGQGDHPRRGGRQVSALVATGERRQGRTWSALDDERDDALPLTMSGPRPDASSREEEERSMHVRPGASRGTR